ncbi:MAG: hypothetical protein E7255_14740 [Lachnospiraceae bacterium]|nr:hypothetical protein [Lachnospiraceae bacterium]
MTGSKPLVRMGELNNLRAVSFQVNCKNPETLAWNRMRKWAAENLNDYEARKYIGYAPFGHHLENSENDVHEYVAMMLLHSEEGGTKPCSAQRWSTRLRDYSLWEVWCLMNSTMMELWI